jgi:hypothetical protein
MDVKNSSKGVEIYLKQIELTCGKNLCVFSILANLYNEQFINLLLNERFEKPKEIIKDNKDLGTYHNKLIILNAMGVFNINEMLYKNLEKFNEIRNKSAHNIFTHNVIDEKTSSSIENKINFLWEQYKDTHSETKDYNLYEKLKIVEFRILSDLISIYSDIHDYRSL